MATALATVTAKVILVGSLCIRKGVDKGITVKCERRELAQHLKKLTLDLPILHPYFFKVDVMAPLTLAGLTGCKGIVAVRGTVRLGHDCEHIVTEVALPLIDVSVACNLFGQTFPKATILLLEKIASCTLFCDLNQSMAL